MSALVFWPLALGLAVLSLGLWARRREIFDPAPRFEANLRALAPVFIATAVAAFSGEHFTEAVDFVRMVPRWLPLRMAITYLVGIGLLAAGVSLASRVAVRRSAPLLALLFALFVLLIYLPNVVQRPGTRIFWIFPFREGTFAVGAFCIFVLDARPSWTRSGGFALFARLWAGFVSVFFGTQHFIYPQIAPGVPSQKPTPPWVPLPHLVSYATGAALVALGVAALFKKTAAAAIMWVGILMAVLTAVIYVPDLFLARGPGQPITAINFVFDTLLFSGSMLAIGCTVLETTLSSSREPVMKTPLNTPQFAPDHVASGGSIV